MAQALDHEHPHEHPHGHPEYEELFKKLEARIRSLEDNVRRLSSVLEEHKAEHHHTHAA